jgi:uncharacterized protein YdaU (DUF1376 family)
MMDATDTLVTAPHWMPFYPGDFLRDCQHLSAEEIGCYSLLLWAMWSNGGTLPDSPKVLAAIARVTVRRWAKLAPVLLPYFSRSGSVLTQKRLANELWKSRETIAKRRLAGVNSGVSRALKRDQQRLPFVASGNEHMFSNHLNKKIRPSGAVAPRARAGDAVPASPELVALLGKLRGAK